MTRQPTKNAILWVRIQEKNKDFIAAEMRRKNYKSFSKFVDEFFDKERKKVARIKRVGKKVSARKSK
jgi:hypothetical protein